MPSNFLTRNLKQTAVYWGNPVSNGYGGWTLDSPVEISVRWEDRNELFTSPDGREEVSSAIIYTAQDVDIGGYLFLGELTDLSSSQLYSDEDDSFKIRQFSKSPNQRVSGFARKAFL